MSQSLHEIRQQVSKCGECPQRITAQMRVSGVGSEKAEVMVIFPNPGFNDNRDGTAGHDFDAMLLIQHMRRLGIPFGKVYITHLIKCFPGFTKGVGFAPFVPQAMETCPPQHLMDEIIAVNPKLIVTVGPIVTKYFDIKGGINQISGRIHETELGPVLPLTNPTALNKKGPRELVNFVTSLRLIKLMLNNGFAVPPEYMKTGDPADGEVIGLDIETTWLKGMNEHDVDIWSIGLGNGDARYTEHFEDFLPKEMRGELRYVPVMHNAKFDLEYMERDGWKIPKWHDTILQAHLLGYGPLKLKGLVPIVTGHSMRTFKEVQKGVSLEENREEALDYCADDAWGSWVLHQNLYPEIQKRGLTHLYEKELKITTVLRGMERKGLPLSMDRLSWVEDKLNKEIAEHTAELGNTFKNADDDKEFAAWFWEGREDIAPRTERKKLLSCKRDDLLKKDPDAAGDEWEYKYCTPEQLPIVMARVDRRRKEKFLTTYISHWKEGDGWVHPSFNQTGTVTWRFSCSDPNVQNIARIKGIPLHQLFVAPKGWKLVAADYSLLELVVLANISKDPVMLRAFEIDRITGGYSADLHQMRIDSLDKIGLWDRRGIADLDRRRTLAKNVNYGIPYGLTKWSLSKRTDTSFDEAQEMIDTVYADWKNVLPWQEAQLKFAMQYGFVKTFDGRPLYTPGIFAPWGKIRSRAENQTKNMPIQGGAAEIVKDAMIRCWDAIAKWWPGQVYIISQIHDELLFLVRDEAVEEFTAFVTTTDGMRDDRHTASYLIDAKVGESWGDIKKVDNPFADDDDEEREAA